MGRLIRIGRALTGTVKVLLAIGKVVTFFLGFPVAIYLVPKNPLLVSTIGVAWFSFFAIYFLDTEES